MRDLYKPTVYGVGFMGEGPYKAKINKKTTKEYNIWHSMMDRCYNPKHSDRYPTYKDCIICEEWHNFQNFASWYEDNYYEIPGEKMALDKDILVKGNKVYSPETCVFVPKSINSLFVKADSVRGDLPIGVRYNRRKNKYESKCSVRNKEKHLGYYNSPEEAYQAYKTFKEKHVKEVADQYIELIPQELYDAMYDYEVECDD